MSSSADLSKCYSFVSCQINPPPPHEHPAAHHKPRPAVTISRQTGAGAMEVAQKLADLLQARQPVPCRWTVFDKNLVVKMLEEHNLPEQLARFIPEDRISYIRDMVEEVLGLHPPSETLIRQISETIVHLAEIGHVILVGRAANVATRHMRNVFHVRLIAPLDKRVAQVMARGSMSHEAALEFVKKEDAARKHYLKTYFKVDTDDQLLYDMILNTDRLTSDEAAEAIGERF